MNNRLLISYGQISHLTVARLATIMHMCWSTKKL